MSKKRKDATPEMKALLRRTGKQRGNEAAMDEFAVALTTPLRQGIMSGDITSGIFEEIPLDENATSEFPLDFLAPGTEKDHIAYTIPNHGYIPEKTIEGDYVQVPIFDVGNSKDWLLKYARDARWDIVSRALQVFKSGFVKKKNDDAWHLLLGAGVDRNIVVFDTAASAGQFTKRLISLMKTTMRRNGGGNSSSINRGKLTDLYLSPEGVEDIRNWGVDQVDEFTRREIFTAEDGSVVRVFSVNLHDIDELGEGQEYQLFFDDQLSASMQASDVEVLVGLDLENKDSFVMPIREELQVFNDDALHRTRKAGIYGWTSYGLATLDNRRVLLASM